MYISSTMYKIQNVEGGKILKQYKTCLNKIKIESENNNVTSTLYIVYINCILLKLVAALQMN